MKKAILGILTATVLSTGTVRAQKPTGDTAEAKVPVIVLTGPIEERGNPLEFFGPSSDTLRDLTQAVDRAANDPDVAGMVVRLESPSWNLSQVMGLRSALMKFRETGKPLYISADAMGLDGYLLGSTGTIVMPPVAVLDLHGMGFSLYYFADMLEKLGVEAQTVNTGKFKDAFDPFVHNEMQEGTRIQMTALLDDYFQTAVEAVAEGRGIDEAEARKILTNGPYGSLDALDQGAIDLIAYNEDLEADLEEEIGEDVEMDWDYVEDGRPKPEMPNFMSLLMGNFGASMKRPQPDHVAVVYALGPIMDGRQDNSNPLVRNETIASEDFLDLLDEVSSEENLKAIVLRVDSPGGSAIASDRIWNRLEAIQSEGIPIVVSMGGVAASGGYYISMGADKILAEPTTITGSIGVIGGKFTLGETYDKVGVHKQSIGIGENFKIYSETEPWGPNEEEVLNGLLDYIYDEFTSKAAIGRGKTQEEIKELGGGRIWSGTAALENGLIDQLGGLEDAIILAEDISGSKDVKVIEYPKELTFEEIIQQALTGELALSMNAGASMESNPLFQSAALFIPKEHLGRLVYTVMAMQDRPTAMTLMPLYFDLK